MQQDDQDTLLVNSAEDIGQTDHVMVLRPTASEWLKSSFADFQDCDLDFAWALMSYARFGGLDDPKRMRLHWSNGRGRNQDHHISKWSRLPEYPIGPRTGRHMQPLPLGPLPYVRRSNSPIGVLEPKSGVVCAMAGGNLCFANAMFSFLCHIPGLSEYLKGANLMQAVVINQLVSDYKSLQKDPILSESVGDEACLSAYWPGLVRLATSALDLVPIIAAGEPEKDWCKQACYIMARGLFFRHAMSTAIGGFWSSRPSDDS